MRPMWVNAWSLCLFAAIAALLGGCADKERTFIIHTQPTPALIKIDGSERGLSPVRETLVFNASKQSYVITADKPGYKERRIEIDRDAPEDLQLFTKLSGKGPFATRDDVPLSVVIPTFITSELKTAFQIGFMIFIPFLVIDLVVASVLMSMGMMMLSPMLVSLPFKIMLFVLVDGWTLLLGSLAASFHR